MRGIRSYGENLKIGKDRKEMERGKCTCSECNDFIRTDEATETIVAVCRPAFLKKVNHSSSDFVLGVRKLKPSIGCMRKNVAVQVQRSGKMRT